MSTFSWKKDEIDKNLPDFLREELYQELDNEDEKISLSYKAKHTDSFKDFKRRYRIDKEEQKRELSGLKDTTLTLVQEMGQGRYDMSSYQIVNMTPEDIIKASIKFYSYLKDPDLTKTYMQYLINEREHINIQSAEGKNISKLINGRAISTEKENVYISLYMKNFITDIISFIHETAHMLSLKLFVDHMNPLIKKHFREIEAYYIEFLSCIFLGMEFTSVEVKDSLIFDTLEDAYNNAYVITIQNFASKFLFIPNNKKVNKYLNSLGLKDEKDDVSIYLRRNYGTQINRYNSIMIAFDLFSNYQNDLEAGLSEYKRLLTSNITDIESLLSEFNITYTKDNCEKALNAARILKI